MGQPKARKTLPPLDVGRVTRIVEEPLTGRDRERRQVLGNQLSPVKAIVGPLAEPVLARQRQRARPRGRSKLGRESVDDDARAAAGDKDAAAVVQSLYGLLNLDERPGIVLDPVQTRPPIVIQVEDASAEAAVNEAPVEPRAAPGDDGSRYESLVIREAASIMYRDRVDHLVCRAAAEASASPPSSVIANVSSTVPSSDLM